MTNPRETSVMMPVEPSEAVLDAMCKTLAVAQAMGTTLEGTAFLLYRAIIAAHMQEQDQ